MPVQLRLCLKTSWLLWSPLLGIVQNYRKWQKSNRLKYNLFFPPKETKSVEPSGQKYSKTASCLNVLISGCPKMRPFKMHFFWIDSKVNLFTVTPFHLRIELSSITNQFWKYFLVRQVKEQQISTISTYWCLFTFSTYFKAEKNANPPLSYE